MLCSQTSARHRCHQDRNDAKIFNLQLLIEHIEHKKMDVKLPVACVSMTPLLIVLGMP